MGRSREVMTVAVVAARSRRVRRSPGAMAIAGARASRRSARAGPMGALMGDVPMVRVPRKGRAVQGRRMEERPSGFSAARCASMR